jgi:hypothetical protein
MPAGTSLAPFNRLMFTARADRPMRVSVELRTTRGDRWHRSVYLDQQPRAITVFFDELTPRGMTTPAQPDLVGVDTVLFVVDTVNSKPGSSGQFWLDEIRYGR